MIVIVGQCAVHIQKDELLPHSLFLPFLASALSYHSAQTEKLPEVFTLRKFLSLLGQLACHLIDDVHGVQAAGIADVGHALFHSGIQLVRVIARADIAAVWPLS